MPEQIAATYRPFSVNSLWRLPRLERGLKAVRTASSVKDAIGDALRDHFGHPNSLCKHDDPRLGTGDRYHTVASSIVDLTAGDYWISSGPPCENEYRRLPWNLYQEEAAPAPRLAAVH